MKIKHDPKKLKQFQKEFNEHINDKTVEHWAKTIHKHISKK